jgi:hypothetical protein
LIAREIEVSSELAFHFGNALMSSDTSEGGRRVVLVVDMNRILLRNGAALSIKDNRADFQVSGQISKFWELGSDPTKLRKNMAHSNHTKITTSTNVD